MSDGVSSASAIASEMALVSHSAAGRVRAGEVVAVAYQALTTEHRATRVASFSSLRERLENNRAGGLTENQPLPRMVPVVPRDREGEGAKRTKASLHEASERICTAHQHCVRSTHSKVRSRLFRRTEAGSASEAEQAARPSQWNAFRGASFRQARNRQVDRQPSTRFCHRDPLCRVTGEFVHEPQCRSESQSGSRWGDGMSCFVGPGDRVFESKPNALNEVSLSFRNRARYLAASLHGEVGDVHAPYRSEMGVSIPKGGYERFHPPSGRADHAPAGDRDRSFGAAERLAFSAHLRDFSSFSSRERWPRTITLAKGVPAPIF